MKAENVSKRWYTVFYLPFYHPCVHKGILLGTYLRRCFCFIRMCNKLLGKSKFFFLVSKRMLAICWMKDKSLDGSPGVLCTSLYRMSSRKSIAGSCANSSTPWGLKDSFFVCVSFFFFFFKSCVARHSDLSPEGRTYPLKRSGCSSFLQIHLSPGSSFSTSFPLPRFLIFPLSRSGHCVCVLLCLTLCNSL